LIIEASGLISTKVSTSKEFLRILYGIVHVFNNLCFQDKDYVGILVTLYPDKDANILAADLYHSQNDVARNQLKEVKEIINVFQSCYTPNPKIPSHLDLVTQKYHTSADGYILYLDQRMLCLYFLPRDFCLQFPTSRERLAIRKELKGQLEDLSITKETYAFFKKLLLQYHVLDKKPE
jgi:hypothetical protein